MKVSANPFTCLVGALLMLAPIAQAAQSIEQYGRECARLVAPLKAFSCQAGVVVPITVNGKTPAKYEPQMLCDKPALLPADPAEKSDGQCVPNSRALVLQDDSSAQISAFCRQKMIRPEGTHLYDEVDVIAHSLKSGRTCWFQAQAASPLKADRGIDGRYVPPPTQLKPEGNYPSARKFWHSPAKTAQGMCVRCHDSGPFMYSPFIAQTNAVPGNPFGLYRNDVGAAFKQWPKPFGISTRGNTCTACHRMGNMNSCNVAMRESTGQLVSAGTDEWGQKFPQSHWMSPGDLHSKPQWDEAFSRSVAQLAACCKDPKGPGCLAKGYEKP